MVKYCKNIDISNKNFIEEAIWECLKNRDARDFYRQDIQRVIKEYGTIDKMAEKMSEDIQRRDLNLPPVFDDVRIDRSNKKLREITIEDIWQQFYDYVAAKALAPALTRLGYYQCGCVEGKGQIWGIKHIYGFAQKYRYATHSDIRKCYPSIPQEQLFAFLRRVIKNDDLIWLIETLVTHTMREKTVGISIGSRLSIPLCQLYLSLLYHHMEEFHRIRRGKKKKICEKILIFMDDIYIFANSTSNLHKAEKELTRYCSEELGLGVKETWTMIDLENATLDAMGFRINKGYVKMRRINYLRTKKALNKFRKNPNEKTAMSLISGTTNVKYSDSYRFRKKYQWKSAAKKARRLISHESKVRNKAAGSGNHCGWQYGLLPDSAQRAGSGSEGSGDRRNA